MRGSRYLYPCQSSGHASALQNSSRTRQDMKPRANGHSGKGLGGHGESTGRNGIRRYKTGSTGEWACYFWSLLHGGKCNENPGKRENTPSVPTSYHFVAAH